MSKFVAAAITIVAALALAAGGTVTLVNLASPDRGVDLRNAPAPNGADGVVDYGTSGR